MSKIKEVAHIAYIQRHWQENQNPDGKDFFTTLAKDISEARRQGLKVYVAFELLNAGREKIELPTALKGNFASQDVRASFIDVVTRVATTYKPDYFLLNVEANAYKVHNPTDYEAFRSLYEKAYTAIKKTSSKTKVGVSLVYSDQNNKDCIDESDINKFKDAAHDFSKTDIFAVSTYPMCYIIPSRLPDKFLADLAKLSSKPLFISETGWVSKGIAIIGSESNQAKYIEALGRSAKFAIRSNKSIEAINYVGLIDPSKDICDAIIKLYPSLSWYCNLSLLDLNGNPKPAYTTLKILKTSLSEPVTR